MIIEEGGTGNAAIISSENDLSRLQLELIQKYDKIEGRGISVISNGQTVGNPILTGETKDPRYSISAIGRITDPLDSFLREATKKIKEVGPNARYVPDGFRHITFREIIFNKSGRRETSISSKTVMDYYQALRKQNFHTGPVCLGLYRIIASIDREQPSVSIIAGLLPKDLNIIAVRERMGSVAMSGRLGDIPLAYVTLARLPYPPKRDGDKVPLLDRITKINNSIPPNCETVIDSVDVISTTSISYVDVAKHVFIWPPVSLTGEQSQDPVRYLKPKQRLQM